MKNGRSGTCIGARAPYDAPMKARFTTIICTIALSLATIQTSHAQQNPSTVVKATDAVVVRPLCFVSTLVGGTLFVVSLPITAIAKKTKPAADALVVAPAKATFKRPLGDMDAMAD